MFCMLEDISAFSGLYYSVAGRGVVKISKEKVNKVVTLGNV